MRRSRKPLGAVPSLGSSNLPSPTMNRMLRVLLAVAVPVAAAAETIKASISTHSRPRLPPFQISRIPSKTKAGWTVGAGAEWMFARNWSAKAEYLYLDLGNASAIGRPSGLPPDALPRAAYTWNTRENIVRAGVNYHFN